MKPISKSVTKPFQNEDYYFHPTHLSEADRYNHVVSSLFEYNKGIIFNNPIGASMKFKKLTTSPFVFMRGTADLMYRDLHGTDADKSIVLCMGDVHLENYGVMETNKGSLVWGLNDFDESHFAPFTWDIKRGATSVILAAMESNPKKPIHPLKAKKMAVKFIESYIKTILKESEMKDYPFKFKQGSNPPEINRLFQESSKIIEDDFLRKNYLDPNSSTPQFRNTDEIERIILNEENLLIQIQESLDSYMEILQKAHKVAPSKIILLDLAKKTGSGTGSIGLWRYYALVELTYKKGSKIIILEIKQERKSVLDPYVGGGMLKFNSEGSRVAYAENIHLQDANPFYGYIDIDDISYLVRKRSPFKNRVALSKLKKNKQFSSYTEACGKALAFAHLKSDNHMKELYPNIENPILHYVNPESFSHDISGFASKMADQVRQDWKYFNRAYDQGIFNFNAPPFPKMSKLNSRD